MTTNDAYAEYKKRIQQRQTVIFGSITAVLALLLLFGTLFWTGLLPFPFDRGFSKPQAEAVVVPCVAEDAKPVTLAKTTVRVYNSGDVSGLAASVGKNLATAGVVVSETTNWAGDELPDSVRLIAGPTGVAAAYTLRAFFPDAQIQFDESNVSDVVDVVIGKGWSSMETAPTAEQFASAMTPISGCSEVN